jgi:Flp pilus assembly protein CpaB
MLIWTWFRRTLLFLLAVGLTSGVLTWIAMKQQMEKMQRYWETTQILCARRDVAQGAQLSADDIAVRDFPLRFTTDDFILWSDEPTAEAPIGRRLAVAVRAGDPLLTPFFADPAER